MERSRLQERIIWVVKSKVSHKMGNERCRGRAGSCASGGLLKQVDRLWYVLHGAGKRDRSCGWWWEREREGGGGGGEARVCVRERRKIELTVWGKKVPIALDGIRTCICVREGGGGGGRERECVCVRERERERERERGRARECVCVCEREQGGGRERVCVCERERESVRARVCVCVCDRMSVNTKMEHRTLVSARHNWDARAPLWVSFSKGFWSWAKNVLSPSGSSTFCGSWEQVNILQLSMASTSLPFS